MLELSASDLSILMVEPSKTQQKAISKEFEKASVQQIEFCADVSSAMAQAKQSQPDLIVSAMHFSDGTALDLVEQLKAEEKFADTPFILISSETRKNQLEIYRQSGVVAILPKPFHSEHLLTAINSTLDLLSTEEMDLSYFDVRSLRVLVVDDSRFARKFVMRVLSNLGIEQFTEAEDGKEAINILQDSLFDLVVTDYNMPEVNGKELTEYIRQKSHQSHIPVLMVSSEANETQLANIEQSGVNALCDKPFEPENVKKILYRLLDENEE